MDTISAFLVVAVGALFLAGGLFALNGPLMRESRSEYDDRDADGEPDETPDQKARARERFDRERQES